MAVLSPALVIAMCVMFVLTRLHAHFYIFEHPLLFGLIYCLEPSRPQLEAISRLSGPSTSSNTTSNPAKRKTKPQAQTAPKPKLTASSLTVRRTILSATFFSSEAEFPHHRQLDHLLTLCCGFFASYAFEEAASCFFPTLLANSRSTYVAVFCVAFAVIEALRISLGMASGRLLLVLGGMAWLVASFLIMGGDFATFVHFDQAFGRLTDSMSALLKGRLAYDDAAALLYARRVAVGARLFVALAASFISTSVAAPARYFSRLDYGLFCEYRDDEMDRRDDPYYLGKPTQFTILKVALDYVIPASVVFLWCVNPREDGWFGSWRLLALIACVLVRFFTVRIRLQGYLDSAIDAYRSFWTEKSMTNIVEAGKRISVKVISNSYFLLLITSAYVAPAVIPLMLIFVAKSDGAVQFGVCPVASSRELSPLTVFVREIAAFLAWWSIASYTLFATLSLCYECLVQVLDPGARERGIKLPPPSSSSERRKQKRMMRQVNA